MTRIRRSAQRGSAMLVTMILVTALLAGVAVVASLQFASNRATDLTRNGLAALYCAEAGLMAARPTIMGGYDQWPIALAAYNSGPTQPAWLSNSVFSHDIDADGIDDFQIYLQDNDDEAPPTPDNPLVDIDSKVFIVSKCIKYPDTPKVVKELVQYTPAQNCYRGQLGGCNGRGNNNTP